MTHQYRRKLTAACACTIAMICSPPLTIADSDNADNENAGSVFDMARSFPVEGPVYIYDVEFDLDGLSAAGTVNMAAEEGERLTVSSPPREQWSEEFADEVSEFERNLEGDIWCQQMMEDIASYKTVTPVDDTLTYVVNMGVDQNDKEDAKFARHVVTTITLSTHDGAVLNYSMHAPKPFRPVMVAKINRLDVNVNCERSPDGRTFAKSMRAEVEGRAFMKKFSELESRKISNLRLP